MPDIINPFILKVILSFIVGGVWIAGITIIAEHIGTKIGGMVAALPSTILISFAFIGLTQGAEFIHEVTVVVPLVMSIDIIFLFLLIILLKRGLFFALIIAFICWFIMAVGINALPNMDWIWSIPLYLIVTIAVFYTLESLLHIPSLPKNKKTYTKTQIILRAVFSGIVIVSAIITAKSAGPVWGGIIACFPAVYTSTMVILSIVQSKKFAQATGKTMILTSSPMIIFALAVYYILPHFGLLSGLAICYLISFIWLCMFLPAVKKMS